MNDDMKSHRDHLIQANERSVGAFDKALLTLSGGGLALSLTFISDIVSLDHITLSWTLLVAWISWASSLALTLISFYGSHRALVRAITDLNEGKGSTEKAGGGWSTLTHVLNVMSLVAFLCGVGFMVCFVFNNLGGSNEQKTSGKAKTVATAEAG
jgi:hypothetical protein